QRGRLEWLTTEFDDWANPERYRTTPQDAWQKVKGHRRLRPAQQQALQLLAGWREQRAIAADKPREWILKDNVLLDIARNRQRDQAALNGIRDMPATVVRRHGDTLIELCQQARQKEPLPLAQAPEQLTPQQQPIVDLLMAALR